MAGVRKKEVEKAARKILEHLHSSDAELSVLLTGDEDIREINREYRNIDRPTDVIAFAMREGEFGDVNDDLLGDVVISVETAKRQSAERVGSLMDEVIFLLIHGILHLHGFDHEGDDAERIRMEEKERDIFENL
jgi:probable rRNA maturation factor